MDHESILKEKSVAKFLSGLVIGWWVGKMLLILIRRGC